MHQETPHMIEQTKIDSRAAFAVFRMEHLPLLVIIASCLANLLILYAFPDAGGDWGESRVRHIIWSVVTFSAVLLCLFLQLAKGNICFPATITHRSVRLYTYWTAALLFLILLEGCYGLIRQNPVSFVIGDTFKYLLFIAGFYLLTTTVRDLRNIDRILVAMSLFSIFPGLGVGAAAFALGYVIAYFATTKTKTSFLLLLATCVYTLSIGKTTVILVPVLFLFALFIFPQLTLRKLIIPLAIVLVTILLVFSFSDIAQHTGAYMKGVYFLDHFSLSEISSGDYHNLDLSTYQRIREVVLVWEKFNNGNILDWLIGYGNGAVYKASGFTAGLQQVLDSDFGSMAHHIHINPVFIFHQWGLIGCLLLLCLFLLLLGSMMQLRRTNKLVNTTGNRTASASFLMLISFISYGSVNPPKGALLFAGILLAIYCYSLAVTRSTRLEVRIQPDGFFLAQATSPCSRTFNISLSSTDSTNFHTMDPKRRSPKTSPTTECT